MDYTDLVCIIGVLCFFWWGAMSSLLERKRSFNNRNSLRTLASGYMNRSDELPPDCVDCEWEFVRDPRGLKTHHRINLAIFALVAIYYLSDWIAYIVIWLFL